MRAMLPWMRRQGGPRAPLDGIRHGNRYPGCVGKGGQGPPLTESAMVTTDAEFPGGTRGQCGRVSVIAEPHSVAKGPPEWSHETEFPGGTRSNPDRRGGGCLCDQRVQGTPPGDNHHHPS